MKQIVKKSLFEFHKGTDPLTSLDLGHGKKIEIFKAFQKLVNKYRDSGDFTEIYDLCKDDRVSFGVEVMYKNSEESTFYYIIFNDLTKKFVSQAINCCVFSEINQDHASLESAIKTLNMWIATDEHVLNN